VIDLRETIQQHDKDTARINNRNAKPTLSPQPDDGLLLLSEEILYQFRVDAVAKTNLTRRGPPQSPFCRIESKFPPMNKLGACTHPILKQPFLSPQDTTRFMVKDQTRKAIRNRLGATYLILFIV
jgi:hypothetical protein